MRRFPQKGRGSAGTRLFLGIVICLAAAGCAAAFSDLRPGIQKRGHYIEGVPFYRQTESTCGPAALASVFAFWRHPASLEQITSRVYLPQLRGTLPMDIESYAREYGFQTESSSGSLDRLKETIRKDVPVICLLDLGFSLYRKPHYVTAVGFDDENRVIVVHDGSNPDQILGYASFEKAWDRAGRWMLVIVPKRIEAGHAR